MSAYHLFPIQIKNLRYKDKLNLFKFFKNNGFQLQVHYKPIILQEYYKKKYKLNPKLFRNTINFYKSAISAPIFPELKEKI